LALSKEFAFLYTIEGHGFSNHKDDFGLIKETFDRNNIVPIETLSLPKTEKAFVVIPGSDLVGSERLVSEELKNIKKVILFITSDEAGQFDVDKIEHPNIKIWVQSPYKKHEKYFKMPIGAPMSFKKITPEYTVKTSDIFFAGQITHQRRQELNKAISYLNNVDYVPTPGFMQGDPPELYYKKMSKAKIVPAPAGSVTIDSFRFYESLEMLALPIGDVKDSSGENFNFWDYTFSEIVPVPKTNNWFLLSYIVDNCLEDYPANMHKAVSWWIKYKRDFSNKIMEQINEH
jgi:hypothetical protein